MYTAAIVALNNFKNDYPDSQYLEEAYYLVIDADYKLALKSIPSKQQQRYKEVVEYYKEFLDRFPNSGHLRDAEKLYAESLFRLKTYKNPNS